MGKKKKRKEKNDSSDFPWWDLVYKEVKMTLYIGLSYYS